MVLKVKPFRSSWAREAHLGPFVSWNDIDQVEVGLNLTVPFLGLRFTWGHRVIDPSQVDKSPHWELGTRFQNDMGPWRYARAGEDLVIGTVVEADLAGRMAQPPPESSMQVTSELIWGGVKAAKEVDPQGITVLGWPEVAVKKGRFCWIKEPPPGAEFKKES